MAGGSFKGDGTLVVGEDRYPVRYRLDTFMRRGLMDGAGVVSNEGRGVAAAFDASRATLDMAHGMSAPIIITRWSPGAKFSEFLLAGAIEPT